MSLYSSANTIPYSISSHATTQTLSIYLIGLEPRGLSIDLPPENIAVEADREATLYCISNAPDSTYRWFKDDSPIDLNSRRYRLVVDGVLTIADVEEDDFGIYRCEVTGADGFEGTRTSDALIDVYCKKKKKKQISRYLIFKKSSF